MLTYEKDYAEFLTRTQSGERVEVDEEMFNYFLEALRPQFMSRTVKLCDGSSVYASFGFAEGAGTVCAFWRRDGKHYAQNTTMNGS